MYFRFFGGFAAEKTPPRRTKFVHAPKGADEIADFVGGDKRVRNPAAAGPIWKRSFQIDKSSSTRR